MIQSSAPILVTGAGRNIGLHLARRLLADGRAVVAHYRSETPDLEPLAAAGAELVQGDLDHEQGIRGLAETVLARSPRLSGVIHNASAFAATPADPGAAAAMFRDYWGLHMLAPYLLTRLLEPALDAGAAPPGDIVMITDIYADNPTPEYDLYCATKAGMQNLALGLAKRLAPRIKVNVIAPGPISFTAAHGEAARARILAQTPLGRLGSPESIYLALQAILANDYLTGAVIPVDGGRRLGR